jgi:hypothetical protein
VPGCGSLFAAYEVQIVIDFGLYTKRVCTNVASCTWMVRFLGVQSAMKKVSAEAGFVRVTEFFWLIQLPQFCDAWLI